jgi:asparagine synthase (glutamine-hydrolysing)
MLSGGLDSGALAALGARRGPDPLPTYSLIFPDRPEIDERRWIDVVLGSGRFHPRFVPIRGPEALAQSGLRLATREHPADGYGHGRLDRLMAAAAADGVRGLLDGHGGDEVISSGIGRLGELAAGRRPLALWRATRGIAPLTGLSRGRLALAALAADAPGRLARAAARRLTRDEAGERRAWRRMVRDDLARRSGLVARAQAPRPAPAGATAEEARHLALLDPVALADGFESLARLARPHRVEPRFPFFDERVVAICLSRPAAEKLRDGQARALLRQAMAGLLPDAVRLRATKTDFRPVLAAELSGDRDGRLARLLGPGDHAVADFVDMGAFRALAGTIRAGGAEARDLAQAWRVLSLADWLSRLDEPNDLGGIGHEP